MEIKKNERKFSFGEFKDFYKNDYTLQKSSLATKDCIILGIKKPKVTIFDAENMGKYVCTTVPTNWMIESTMHLTREQVADLLPHLQHFVETGEL